MDVTELIKKYTAGERNFNGITLDYANLQGVTLQGANLAGANLREADLRQANLSQADLSGSNLEDADLRNADLQGTNLSAALLNGASFQQANLKKANLKGAFLEQTDFRKADLTEADLKSTNLNKALLDDTNLTGTILSNSQTQQVEPFAVEVTPSQEIISEQPLKKELAAQNTEHQNEVAPPSQEAVATKVSPSSKNLEEATNNIVEPTPSLVEKQSSSEDNNPQPTSAKTTPQTFGDKQFTSVVSTPINEQTTPEFKQVNSSKPDVTTKVETEENQALPLPDSQPDETTESKQKETQAQEKRSPWNLFGQRNSTDSQY